MPATADILPIEAPQPNKAVRKPKQAQDDDDRQAFPDAIRQVEAESDAKPDAPSARTTDTATPESTPDTSSKQTTEVPNDRAAAGDSIDSGTETGTENITGVANSASAALGDDRTPAAVLTLVPARETLSAATALTTGLQQPAQNIQAVTANPAQTTPQVSGENLAQSLKTDVTAASTAPAAPALAKAPSVNGALQEAPAQLSNALLSSAQPVQQSAVAASSATTAATPPLRNTAPTKAPQAGLETDVQPKQATSETSALKVAPDRSAQIAATAVQTTVAPERAAPSVLANLEELPTPELARIDLAARKTAVASTGSSASGILEQSGAASLAGKGNAAAANLASGMARAADTSTPIVLNQATPAQQPAPQLPSDILPVQAQPAAEPTIQTATAQTGQMPQATTVNATQSLSFAQQMAQSAAQPPAQQLGISIARGAREGLDRIEIQLHPAELGRVDVRMELGHDGRIMAVVSAERADTLEQLRRDIHQLERALADAGFDTDSNSFRFDEGNGDMAGNGRGDGGEGTDIGGGEIDPTVHPAAAARTMHFDGIRVDISV